LASTASFLTRAAEIALVASGCATCAGMPASGEQVGKPAPPVGRLEDDLDRAGLELAEEAQELRRRIADPPGQHDRTGRIQGDHVRTLAVQVHPDVRHDRASVLSLAQRRTLRHA
jgi:hypothetical protein